MTSEYEQDMKRIRRESETEKWVRSLDAAEIAAAYLDLEDELEIYRNACAGIPSEQLRERSVENALNAAKAIVAWFASERSGPDYEGLARDTHPEGELIWRKWWDRQQEWCQISEACARAALAAFQEDKSQ